MVPEQYRKRISYDLWCQIKCAVASVAETEHAICRYLLWLLQQCRTLHADTSHAGGCADKDGWLRIAANGMLARLAAL